MKFELITTNPVGDVVSQLLVNRGIPEKEVAHYLRTTDADLYSPNLLQNIEKGYDMLMWHLSNDGKILVIVDSDVDGLCSASLILNYLYFLNPDFVLNNVNFVSHEHKEHGLNDIEVPDDITLVLITDGGTNDIEAHKALFDRGIDVLCIDHHQKEDPMPNKYACIINCQDNTYPNKTLSGAGVVYKFCKYMDLKLGLNYADYFLDLVALSEISDMMDIRNMETIHLIRKGLSSFNNKFFRYCLQKQNYVMKGEITNVGIAFYITPILNALIRMGSVEDKQLLFSAFLEYKGQEYIPSTKRGSKEGDVETVIEQAWRIATNAKRKQTTVRDELTEYIERLIQEKHLLDNKILIICVPQDHCITETITGLVCNEIAQKYQKPTLLLNEQEEFWKGSFRNPSRSSINNLRDYLLASDLVTMAAGHNNAGGTCLPKDCVQRLLDKTNQDLSIVNENCSYRVDFVFDNDNFNSYDIIQIDDCKGLWGQEMPEPYIAVTNLKITRDNLQLMSPDKHPTLKIKLKNGVEIIKFKSSEEEYNSLISPTGCVIINVIGKCNKNVWNDRITPQITVTDYEIIERREYDF